MKGWLGLLAYVIIFDIYAIRTSRKTLSAVFYEAVRQPKKRWYVVVCWAVLTCHLFGLDNGRLDNLWRAVARCKDTSNEG